MVDFNFHLNRQGPRGPQGYKGDKGDDGKTPVPRTGTNTSLETTVIFDTGDGNPYETPNLKYLIEDRGGDMVMLDRANGTQYYGTPGQATDNSYGIVKLATPGSVLDDPLDNDVVTYKLFDDNNQSIKTVTDDLVGDITQLNTDLGAEVTNRTNADIQLTNKINTNVGDEATARANADVALNNRIDGLDASKADKSDVYTKAQTDSLLNNKSNVGHTHNYNDLTNKPDIGNGTITFKQGNTIVGTMTTNQTNNSTITFADPTGITPGTGLNLDSFTNTLSVKIDNDTLGLNSDGEIEVQNAGTTYSSGDGIDINNDTISAKVDGSTINFDSNGNLIANIPDVSNFVTNSSLANTLGNYPTKTSQQNIINYELATWDDFSYSDKEFSYAKFPFVGSDECPFYYNEPTGDITATSTGFKFNNNCVKYSLGTYEITPGPTKVRFKAKQGDRIIITSADYIPVIISDEDGPYSPQYDGIIDDGHTCVSDDYFSATMDFVSEDASGNELNYQIEVLQDCLISEIETIKTQVASPVGTYSFEYIMANNNPAIEFVVPLDLNGHVKAIFNPDVAGDGLKINSVNKDRIEVDVDGTTIGINDSGKLTYVGTTGDVLPSQTGNAGKFLTTDGSATSWATVSQPDMTQYYTKTQADSLLDGKINITAPVTPLEYDNGIEGAKFVGLDSNHIGTATPITGYSFSFPSTSYITINGNNVQGSANILNALCSNGYVEIPIINNNFIYDNALERAIIFGKYINNNFIMNAIAVKVDNKYLSLVSSDFLDNNVSVGIGNVSTVDRDRDTALALTWTNSYVYYASNNYVSSGATGMTYSVNSDGTLISKIADSTHIRVVAVGTNTLNYDNIDVREPEQINLSGTSMQFGNAWESATNMIEYNGTNPTLSLKYDTNTLGVNANGELYAQSSTPSNMVTTDTTQTITSKKTFNTTAVFTGSQSYTGDAVQISKSSILIRNTQGGASFTVQANCANGTYYNSSINLVDASNDDVGVIVAKNGKFRLVTNNNDSKIYKENSTPINNPTNFLLEKDMLDGTTITYNSSTGKISAAGSTPTKKTITQTSANVSESSGTVTVTDADVTTSTMVSLYPSDTTTETWLTNNLASNIITEGSGSFTFTINGNLPSTFSMYYIIQEIN